MVKKILAVLVLSVIPAASLANGWDWEFGLADGRWSGEEVAWVQRALPSRPAAAEVRAFLPPPDAAAHCKAEGCDDPVELLDNYLLELHGLEPGDPVPIAPEFPLGCTEDCLY